MTRSVRIWLAICSLLVIIMVWIGGYTRLTNAGLSITEWKPIIGIMPPLTEKIWLEEQVKYKNTPEYKKINFDISLHEFKRIYLIEYGHRFFGRLIGIVFIIPFIYFLVRKKLQKNTVIALLIALLLGCLQGFIGWYMVQSGLIDQPYVSQYRLASHLLLATLIFMVLWWQVSSSINNVKVAKSIVILSKIIMILIILQIFIGGLVAGLKAGLIYNTFPLMDGQVVPEGLFNISPLWKNFFENVTTVQFMHRTLGIIILIFAMVIYRMHRTILSGVMLAIVISQVLLGIFTLIYCIPIILASLHQLTAFIVLATIILYYKKIILLST